MKHLTLFLILSAAVMFTLSGCMGGGGRNAAWGPPGAVGPGPGAAPASGGCSSCG